MIERRKRRHCRDRQQRDHPREHEPQTTPLALAGEPARVEELLLGRVELRFVRCSPLERRRQSCAAIELRPITAAIAPLARGPGEVAVDALAVAVLLEPARKPRPLAQERLVSNLDAALTDRDQAALGEDVEHAPAVVAELVERDAPPHGGAAFLGGQPQQQAPGGDPLVRFEALVGRLGQPRHGAAHAARALVRGEPHVAAVAPLPQLQQRSRQQRQGPRFALAVREQPVRESGLESQSGVPRGQLDRAPQLVVVHRADEDVVGGQQRSKLRICGAATVEVRAHGEDDGGSALADRSD